MATAEGKTGKTTSSEQEDLAAQIEALRADLKRVSDSVTRIAKGEMGRAQDIAKERLADAQDMANQKLGEAEDAIRRNPISAIAIAVGLGFLFGLITRR